VSSGWPIEPPILLDIRGREKGQKNFIFLRRNPLKSPESDE
jgi:hypothetical protein